MLEVYDDVFEEQFLNYINYNIRDYSISWQIAMSTGTDPEYSFFLYYVDDKPEYKFILNEIIKKSKFLKHKKVKVKRQYINLYPYGIGGKWHTDSEDPRNITLLFFPCEWKPEYKGATLFKNGNRLEYKKNRFIIFQAELQHKAEIHSNPMNRYTVAYKLELN